MCSRTGSSGIETLRVGMYREPVSLTPCHIQASSWSAIDWPVIASPSTISATASTSTSVSTPAISPASSSTTA